MAVKPIPDGYHSITPYLVVNGAAKIIDFARDAFDAQEIIRMPGPNGSVGHAEIRIGDSVVMMADAGERYPAGNQWWIATHVEDIPPEELKRRAAHAKPS